MCADNVGPSYVYSRLVLVPVLVPRVTVGPGASNVGTSSC